MNNRITDLIQIDHYTPAQQRRGFDAILRDIENSDTIERANVRNQVANRNREAARRLVAQSRRCPHQPDVTSVADVSEPLAIVGPSPEYSRVIHADASPVTPGIGSQVLRGLIIGVVLSLMIWWLPLAVYIWSVREGW